MNAFKSVRPAIAGGAVGLNRETGAARCALLVPFIASILTFACGKKSADSIGPRDSEPEGPARIVGTFIPGSSGFYYNSPVLRDGFLYIGTSRKLASAPARDNRFFKLDAALSEVWNFPLDSAEVRGGAALDEEGNVYFTVQTGKTGGDLSGAEIFVYSLTDQGVFRWRKRIAGRGK